MECTANAFLKAMCMFVLVSPSLPGAGVKNGQLKGVRQSSRHHVQEAGQFSLGLNEGIFTIYIELSASQAYTATIINHANLKQSKI